ncbi:MAG: UDP-N-acetylmuramoyl-tripeptide--D-alanyl-D-alanine ligase [Candidatus Margulisiibacteriota bacterium]|nr:UDP-N-acetylmuramoyl-tripeptide--D-alanyl-D-alanine ligase [Candidatus Margulisiibacteriota bacterium]
MTKRISIDARTICKGDLFIPIKGPNFDGRNFIPEAIKKGGSVLDVKDGLKSLQAMAIEHRNKFNIPIVGVTGSVGKTTTKDMIASIISQEKKVLKNEENFNNEIGVPLTLLKITKKHKAAVIEMAMRGLGEIEQLARIVRPRIAVVTNIGEAHLEFLKSKKNVARAKAEIFKYQAKNDFAVINADDEYFEHLAKNIKCKKSNIITFGITEKASVTPKDLKGIKLPLPGEHIIYNALAAIAVAKIMRLKRSSIKKGLENVVLSSKRMEIINREDGVKIINDTYNANPQSMAAALKVLACLKGRKIAVLGDMFELGKRAKPAHKRIGKLSRELGIDILVSVGKLSREMKANFHLTNNRLTVKKLKKMVRRGDRILVKGSRGMKMEEISYALSREPVESIIVEESFDNC